MYILRWIHTKDNKSRIVVPVTFVERLWSHRISIVTLFHTFTPKPCGNQMAFTQSLTNITVVTDMIVFGIVLPRTDCEIVRFVVFDLNI
jgi:hypothetical protein